MGTGGGIANSGALTITNVPSTATSLSSAAAVFTIPEH